MTIPIHGSASFKKLLSARFLYSVAFQMQTVVMAWQMYTLTHKALFLGLIGLAEAIPALSLALFSGYIVDRQNPLLIVRLVIGLGLVTGLIVWGSLWPGLLGPSLQIAALFFASFLTGIIRSFFHPSMYAITPKLLDREQLAKASAWMTSLYQISSISGPALGGLLFGFIGSFATAGLVCVLLFLAFVPLLLIPSLKMALPQASQHSFKTELLSGAKFVFKHPILFPALSLDMLAVLFGGVTALLPIYASEILHLGPKGLGLLKAAPAIGASVIGLILTRIEIPKKAGYWLLSCVAAFGLCMLIFALSTNPFISFTILLLSGGFDSVSAVIRGAAVQLSSPDTMRGRISAINMMFISSSNELGEFESGFAATLFGVVPSVLIGGCLCLATVLGVAVYYPKLRNLDMQALKEVT